MQRAGKTAVGSRMRCTLLERQEAPTLRSEEGYHLLPDEGEKEEEMGESRARRGEVREWRQRERGEGKRDRDRRGQGDERDL